jgi:acetyl esterase/lipase
MRFNWLLELPLKSLPPGFLPRVAATTALLFLSLLLGGCEATLFAGLNATDQRHGIEQQKHVEFDPQHHLALDIYRPAHATHAPIVVFFYGGSWIRGERAWYRFVGTALSARGITVVIPDYRKYPQVKMDGFMEDAARAVAWTRDHAAELDGSAGDIFVMGHSAGGQIAGLLATDAHWLAPYAMQPEQLAGFIGLAGCYDFMPIPANEKDMLGMFGRTPEEQARAQPVRFVDGNEPPMLLLHGTADKEVEPSNSQSFADAMHRVHGEVTLKFYPGVKHSELLFALSRPFRDSADTLDDVLAFIESHSRKNAITPNNLATKSTL